MYYKFECIWMEFLVIIIYTIIIKQNHSLCVIYEKVIVMDDEVISIIVVQGRNPWIFLKFRFVLWNEIEKVWKSLSNRENLWIE